MTTITQTITALPTAPARTDDPATFITRADAMMAALPTMVTQENTWAGQVNTVSAEMIVNAATATTQAGIATTQAGLATTNGAAQVTLATAQAGTATTQAGNASTSAGTATTQAGIATTQAAAAAVSAAAAAASAAALFGTSTTSLLIAIGTKVFTTQASEAYTAGNWVTATSAANLANWMFGQVISYTGTTLTVDVQVINGSGTYADWNLSISAARGATGATGAAGSFSGVATGTADYLTGANIASASTVNLDTATGNRVHITGTTTITAVTLSRGPRTVIFDGILTLTHNATMNNLPGAVSITTAVGDRAIYESDGTTVYCVSYIKVSGAAATATNLAGGSNGTIPYQSAAGTTQMLAVGTAGQLLQTNGAGAPTWVAAPTGGSLIYLSTVTASNAATADIETTFDSTYDNYVIVADNVTVDTAATTLQCFPKLGGTYTPTADAAYRGSTAMFTSATTYVTSTTSGTASVINIVNSMDSTEDNRRLHFVMEILGPVTSATEGKSITYRGAYRNGVSSGFPFVGGNSLRTTNFICTALTGIRFQASSGNISGTFRLYGIKNS